MFPHSECISSPSSLSLSLHIRFLYTNVKVTLGSQTKKSLGLPSVFRKKFQFPNQHNSFCFSEKPQPSKHVTHQSPANRSEFTRAPRPRHNSFVRAQTRDHQRVRKLRPHHAGKIIQPAHTSIEIADRAWARTLYTL